MALEGFRSLTSARHLEYFKIPLSKKKYLCNQKCRELKTNKTHKKGHKQKNSKNTSSPLPFLSFREHFLCFFVTLLSQNHTKSHSRGIKLSDTHSFPTLCQPFRGHFLFFSKQPSCFCGSWVQFIAPRSPSTISQLSCLNRKSKCRSYFFQRTEL